MEQINSQEEIIFSDKEIFFNKRNKYKKSLFALFMILSIIGTILILIGFFAKINDGTTSINVSQINSFYEQSFINNFNVFDLRNFNKILLQNSLIDDSIIVYLNKLLNRLNLILAATIFFAFSGVILFYLGKLEFEELFMLEKTLKISLFKAELKSKNKAKEELRIKNYRKIFDETIETNVLEEESEEE